LTEIRQHDHHDEQPASQIEAREARGRVQVAIEQDVIDDEPHEERFDHLQARGQEREQEQADDRVSIGS
jgi:hypothetical protein